LNRHHAKGRVVSILLCFWVALLAVPSTRYTQFDGLPFSSAVEALTLALTLPLVLSGTCRRLLRRGLHRSPRWVTAILFCALAGGLALKGFLLTTRAPGFVACYQSTVSDPPAGTCERSFENPLFRFSSTRVDGALDFGPEDWNLSFFNSLRFNFLWEPGVRRRERLPFTVIWRGVVDSRGPEAAWVSYVGEGQVSIGDMLLNLPPVYGAERTLPLEIPSGQHTLRAIYTFDDDSRTSDATRPGPYATFRLRTSGTDEEPADPVRPAPGPVGIRAVGAMVDAIGFGVSLALGLWYGSLLRRETRATVLVAGAIAAVIMTARHAELAGHLGATFVACLLLGLLASRNRSARLLLAYFTLLAVSAFLALHAYPSLETVVYRTAGDDWLTYESFARTVLETVSLEGGEPVFYIQPLFRYIRFAERLLLGDGDPLLVVLGWTALHWTLLWAASVLRGRRPMGRTFQSLFFASAGLTLALAGSAVVVRTIELSLSEHVTWIFLAAAFALLGVRRASARLPAGALFLGMALITRPNQAPALMATAAALLYPVARQRLRPVGAACVVLIAVCLLPLAHNVYYGGRAVLFTTTANHPATLGVPIASLAKLASESTARAELVAQLGGLMFFSHDRVALQSASAVGTNVFAVVMHALQVAWLAAVCLAWRRRLAVDIRLLVLVPALFLAVHVVYDVWAYYPRHILAAYFSMGLVAMAVSAANESRRRLSGAQVPRIDRRERF
jgi:hypothetical protein